MALTTDPAAFLPEETRKFYRAGAQALFDADVPFMVGGAYALGSATGIERHTKDFDLFIRPGDIHRALEVLASIGCRTEFTFPHWLGKAFGPNGDFIDLIFSSGNGVARVDEEWFRHSRTETILGMEMLVCPTEEILWQKSFILERERCDVADVAHFLQACADKLDWDRLLARFADNWRVLFSHLVLFGYIYPTERHRIPARVMHEFSGRLKQELLAPQLNGSGRLCRGTLLSRQQYLIDIHQWGYRDVRRNPEVQMSDDDIALWTAGIEKDGNAHHD
ncbi:MAG: hypothetical protein ACR2IE_04575 [Candidatus Sumerlaeaceae bacterium]